MAKFLVTVVDKSGATTSYTIEGSSVKEVATEVASDYKEASYTVEQLPSAQAGISPNQMPQLVNASLGLMGCIMILIIADYKIRKWLQE